MEAKIGIYDVNEGKSSSISPELTNGNMPTIDSQRCDGRDGKSSSISRERPNENLTSIDSQNQNDDIRVENLITHGNDEFVLSEIEEDDENVVGKLKSH